MNKFLFKSNESDLSKILSILETLQKNTLYITYRIDSCLKKVTALEVNSGLQKQVDEYFDETSPQTEQEAKDE